MIRRCTSALAVVALIGALVTALVMAAADPLPVAVNAGGGLHASATPAPAPGARAAGEPEPQWVEIPPDQPVPQGSHVRLDISNGKRWVNVAAYGKASAAGALPTHDAATHDHDHAEHPTDAAARRRRSADSAVALVPQNDTAAAAAAEPAAGGAAAARLAQHSQSQAKAHGAVQLQNLDQKVHDPTAPGNADGTGSPVPNAHAHGLDELLARGLYRQSQLDDDFAIMRHTLQTVTSATASAAAIDAALEALEDTLHDRANAIEFAAPTSLAKAGPMHGLRRVMDWLAADTQLSAAAAVGVARDGGSTELALLRIRVRAAWLIGTAAQNNDKVQGFALADGAMTRLITAFALALPPAAKPGAAAVDPAVSTARLDLEGKLLYAVSSLLRASGEAKRAFHTQHGVGQLQVLIARAIDPEDSANTKATEMRRFDLLRKAVSLVRDILSDHQFDPTFSFAPLIADLSAPEFCQTLASLAFVPSDVVREQLLHVMHLQLHAGGCRAHYTAPTLVEAVDRLAHYWDARHHNATHTPVPDADHTHAGGASDDSYDLELYHVAQAFLHAARNPDRLHEHVHDEYDVAIGQRTAHSAAEHAKSAAASAVGVVGSRPTDPNAKPPGSGDAHSPVEHEYEADDEAPHPDSQVEHEGERDATAGADADAEDDEEDEDDGDAAATAGRKYKPSRKPRYDPDSDVDDGFDERVHRAVRAAATAAGDSEVDGDADATLDDDGDDDATDGHDDAADDDEHDGPVHESGFPYNPRTSSAA